MKRRTLLQLGGMGLGGALLSPLFSRIAAAGGVDAPRFVFFVEGNGYEATNVLTPTAAAAIGGSAIGGRRHFEDAYPTEVASLADDLSRASSLVALGTTHARIAGKTTVLLGLSSEVTGGGHSAYHGILASRRSSSGLPTGETIDSHLARLVSASAPAILPALRVGYASHFHHPGKTLDYGTCADGPGRALPLVLSPDAAFDLLLSSRTDPARFARDGRLLEVARADAERVVGTPGMEPPDVARVRAYLTAIETNIARRAALSDAVDALAEVPARPTGVRTETDIHTVLAAQASNIAVALQGGLTNVAVLGIGTGADFDTFYDASHQARHDTLHSIEAGGAADLIDTHRRRQMEHMLDLALALDGVALPTGTLLDHTVLVYVGDNGETHHASGTEFPVVLIGGSALGLSPGGRTIVYPRLGTAGHRQISNLWDTLRLLADPMALDRDGPFGGEGTQRIDPGPLRELLP